MKKRMGLIVIITIIAIIVCSLIWRVWPHTFSDLLPFDKASVTSFSAYAMVRHYENEQSYTDTYYRMEDITQPQNSNPEEIFEILGTSRYQQDYRNILPGDVDTVHPDKNFDGNTASLRFFWGDEPDEFVNISFLSNSIITVFVGGESGFHIYHPTNHETIYNLIEYLKTNGTAATTASP